ncbi:MAG: hypothetical protein CHKLHMKO_00418 [Candidatus Argoarchaeum ethanivorans]|uniref:Uncharacterized protein n=1 Tax=Candidatus Argoarchaeum ethanivorans TaxID=2608793 RepID=A0A811TF17_9EURY|nr:MAG: hypothetical protein CHKLHMKO_00418 [Candidatus Argoarchaeum ethanivorans]
MSNKYAIKEGEHKSWEMSNKYAIEREEHEKIKQASLSRIEYNAVHVFIKPFTIILAITLIIIAWIKR